MKIQESTLDDIESSDAYWLELKPATPTSEAYCILIGDSISQARYELEQRQKSDPNNKALKQPVIYKEMYRTYKSVQKVEIN